MFHSTLRSVGGSVMCSIPKPILEALGLQPNSRVGITVTDGKLIFEPQAKPRTALTISSNNVRQVEQ